MLSWQAAVGALSAEPDRIRSQLRLLFPRHGEQGGPAPISKADHLRGALVATSSPSLYHVKLYGYLTSCPSGADHKQLLGAVAQFAMLVVTLSDLLLRGS